MGDDRTAIVGFMVGAGAFALVGETVKRKNGQGKAGEDVRIILGTAIGAILLSLLAEAGSGAASFAKGVAGIALVASVVINGLPVFTGINKVTGAVAGTPATTTTAKG